MSKSYFGVESKCILQEILGTDKEVEIEWSTGERGRVSGTYVFFLWDMCGYWCDLTKRQRTYTVRKRSKTRKYIRRGSRTLSERTGEMVRFWIYLF